MNYETYFKISYGLYVISSFDGEKRNGFIGNTVFQVTAEPAQIAIACNKNNFTAELIQKSGIFTISILKKEARPEIIGTFGYKSGKDVDKFAQAQYKTSKLGAPILTDDSLAWFECKVNNTFDVGTHLIFVGEVNDFGMIDEHAEPLTYAYFREVKKGKAPKNAPTYIDPTKTQNSKPKELYYCPACGYIYDPELGDPANGIATGTPFDKILESWNCPSCGSEKADFVKKE